MNICFFNDSKAGRFEPLTLTRPVDDLRVGIYTIREKWMKAFKLNTFARLIPDYLEGVFEKGEVDKNEECLWINSRYLPSDDLLDYISSLEAGQKIMVQDDVVVAKSDGKISYALHQDNNFSSENLDIVEIEKADRIEYLWDLISLNASQIGRDIKLSPLKNIANTGLGVEAVVHHSENIYINENVTIEPGCIFIAKNGPIIIEEGAVIEAGSTLRGPVAVCKGATVKMSARIYEGTTIGPVCKVGGEVAGCIFHSYTNKAHDGFAGNSIFGQWVNLGANTITSNLKNDYKNVSVMDWKTKKPIETGRQFLGTVMADHSKTAINTMLNTGTVCGVSSNVFIDQLSPKVIESFTWLGPNGPALYRFEKAVEVMQGMMARRNVTLTDEYKTMMSKIFEDRL